MLPVLVASALWWAGWPFQRKAQLMAGLLNLVLIIAGGIALTIVAWPFAGVKGPAGRSDRASFNRVWPAAPCCRCCGQGVELAAGWGSKCPDAQFLAVSASMRWTWVAMREAISGQSSRGKS